MTVQVALRISDDLAKAVDELCASDPESPTRSDVLRRAIEIYVDERRRVLVDDAIVAGYTRLPQSTLDAWGSLSEQQDARRPSIGAILDGEDGGW